MNKKKKCGKVTTLGSPDFCQRDDWIRFRDVFSHEQYLVAYGHTVSIGKDDPCELSSSQVDLLIAHLQQWRKTGSFDLKTQTKKKK